MSTERWNRVDAIFAGALELPADERPAYVERACAGDETLEAEVAGLLRAAESADAYFDGLAPPVSPGAIDPLAPTLEAGHRIGPYCLVRLLGEGGMGAVYEAERADGQFEQRVAIKLVHPSRVRGGDLIQRFLRERQILARLLHPAIARLYDGGVADDGRPYLAMEYVGGVPITEFCDANRLSVPERLRLFGDVGRAVQYAHGQLVIHRDLKPSNILVTGEGQVKLLDFGIAKLLQDDPEETATRTGGRLLTPAYAAPEQIRGGDVTTATDVYQLGVLLYELLTGRRPHATEGRTPFEVERSVCEEEPGRPSRSVDEHAPAARRTDRDSLARALEGDLDTIVLKALDKVPNRRYAGAGALVDDTQRFLDGLPVTARPATVAYRARKFVARHRAGVALAALFVLVLTGYAVTVTAQARQIALERDRARIEAARAEQVTTVFADLFEGADPFAEGLAGGEDVRVRDVLEQGAVRVREELADQPDVQARLLNVIGVVYLNLGLYEDAEPLFREALAVREELPGEPDAAMGQNLSDLAYLLQETGVVEESEALFRRALDIQRRTLDPTDPALAVTLTRFGGLLWFNKGDHAAADSAFREALAIRREALDPDDSDLTSSLNSMANLLHSRGDYAGAEPFYREAIERYKQQLGDHPNVAIVESNFAALLRDKGDHAEAETVIREALEMHRRLQGEENIDVALGLGSLGSILIERGRLAGADSVLAPALEMQRAFFPDDNPYVLRTNHYIARLRMAQGRYAEARSLLTELREQYGGAFPPGHFALADPVMSLGRLATLEGDATAAEPLFREGLSIREAAYPETHWQVATARSALGGVLVERRAFEEAESLLVSALETLEGLRGDDDSYTAATLERLAGLYEAWGRPDEAARYRARLEGGAGTAG